MGDFRKLRVWQNAKDLAVAIYKLVEHNKHLSNDFRLKSQLCSSSISIASNIAEGDELDSNKQSIRHFYIAKGSTAELMTQLIIAHEIGFIEQHIKDDLVSKCEHISLML